MDERDAGGKQADERTRFSTTGFQHPKNPAAEVTVQTGTRPSTSDCESLRLHLARMQAHEDQNMKPKIDERVRKIIATRIKQMLYWRSVRGPVLSDELVHEIARSRVYERWGYKSLGECLMAECGYTPEQAFVHVSWAIKEGCEYREQYGTNKANAGPADSTGRSENNHDGVLEECGGIAGL